MLDRFQAAVEPRGDSLLAAAQAIRRSTADGRPLLCTLRLLGKGTNPQLREQVSVEVLSPVAAARMAASSSAEGLLDSVE